MEKLSFMCFFRILYIQSAMTSGTNPSFVKHRLVLFFFLLRETVNVYTVLTEQGESSFTVHLPVEDEGKSYECGEYWGNLLQKSEV